MNTDVFFSSKSEEWETPQDLFDKINEEFHFTVDVAASDTNHKCPKYYTRQQDGLSQVWCGVVWCNPPYGREIAKWVQKALYSRATTVILLPARTDTAWFHEYVIGKAEVRFIRGRLKFGGSKNSAPFPSMIVIFQ